MIERLRFAVVSNSASLEPWHAQCLHGLEAVADRVGAFDPSTFPMNAPAVDFILLLGPGTRAPATTGEAPLGIWAFQHELDGDAFPFFAEVDDGADVTQSSLLARRSAGAEWKVLQAGAFATEKLSYRMQRDRMLAILATWPARACRRLLSLPVGDRASAVHGASRPPALGPHTQRAPGLAFSAKMFLRRASVAWDRAVRHVQWNIGVLPVPVESLIRPGSYHDSDVQWFPIGKGKRFLADPFGLMRDGVLHVLAEDYPYATARGLIAAIEHMAGRFSPAPEPAITLPVHMSYPYIVEDGGETYCVPETCEANEIALFRAVEFPRRWEKVAVLMHDFAGVDSTIFRHDGRWWLLATEHGPEENATLYAWHANALQGPWIPHAQNPVKCDVRGARPGGTPFMHEGALYRPAQDCSRRYGWRVVIQRVTTLTPTAFEEMPVAAIEAPRDSPFPMGRHTLSRVGDVVLIDGHRAIFVPRALWDFAGLVVRRLWAKVLGR